LAGKLRQLPAQGEAETAPHSSTPEKKVPSGNHDKEGQATVAAFRLWRGLPAFHPWSLTECGGKHAEGVLTK